MLLNIIECMPPKGIEATNLIIDRERNECIPPVLNILGLVGTLVAFYSSTSCAKICAFI